MLCSIKNTTFIYQIFYINSFANSSFNLILFDVTSSSLWSKSAFFTKLAKSLFLAKFDCFSLAVKFSDVNLLNYWIVIYLPWSWSVAFYFQFH